LDFVGASLPLSDTGLQDCARLLNVGAAEIWTILSVETHACGFLPDRRPQILFERHLFHQQTKGVFDTSHPSISASTPGGYAGGAREYDRLHEAVALNRIAALSSASWGLGQVLGLNWKVAGFAGLDPMIKAMQDSEDQQLSAVANFLHARKLHQLLAAHDWSGFAREYNGPDFQKNAYDARLKSAFAGFSKALPSIQVRQAQILLMFLGLNSGAIDGIPGRQTQQALADFQRQYGMDVSTRLDDILLKALLAANGIHRTQSAARA